MRHLLVTNDFPPKVGGIQSYLWELWRRLDPADVTVLTTAYEGSQEWDAQQPFRVERVKEKWLLPTAALKRRINELAAEVDAHFVVLDPVFPLATLGPKLDLPYVVIAHGAEYVIPAELPVTSSIIRRVTNGSIGMIACGAYVADFVHRMNTGKNDVPVVSIPPGVDTVRFSPVTQVERELARQKLGIKPDAKVVVGVSRLVSRKGFDRLIKAAAMVKQTEPDLEVVIAGSGRKDESLRRLIARTGAPVTMLGRVPDADLPALYGAGDAFCMPCHDRWFGLEQEGFGIVFVEAGAAGLASVAGLSGGSGEAVLDGETGFVVDGSVSPRGIAAALKNLLADEQLRIQMGEAARNHAAKLFSYDHLAHDLQDFLTGVRTTSEK